MRFGKHLLEANGIKGWKNAHADIARMRANSRAASMSFKIVKLNKDGNESKMTTDTFRLASEEKAKEQVEYWRQINPNRTLRYNLYVDDKLIGEV